MELRTAAALATASATLVLLAGCTDGSRPSAAGGAAPAASSSSSAAPSPSGKDLAVCPDLGNAEHVSVDLSTALPLEGGPYTAVVSSPELGESTNGPFDAHSEARPGGWFAADVTAEPVTVSVSVTDGSGREVYAASTLATPQLYQPNGARCDGENHAVQLVATPDHRLVDLPAGETLAKDARGRWTQALCTGCGVVDLHDESVRGPHPVWWVRAGGPLVAPDGGAPAGWNSPLQRGWVSIEGDRLRFEDERGHVEVFERAPVGYVPPPCPHGFTE